LESAVSDPSDRAESDQAKENRTGLAFWAPLIAASLALFIVVVD